MQCAYTSLVELKSGKGIWTNSHQPSRTGSMQLVAIHLIISTKQLMIYETKETNRRRDAWGRFGWRPQIEETNGPWLYFSTGGLVEVRGEARRAQAHSVEFVALNIYQKISRVYPTGVRQVDSRGQIALTHPCGLCAIARQALVTFGWQVFLSVWFSCCLLQHARLMTPISNDVPSAWLHRTSFTEVKESRNSERKTSSAASTIWPPKSEGGRTSPLLVIR